MADYDYLYKDDDPDRQAVLEEMRMHLDASVGLGPKGTGEGFEAYARLLYPYDTEKTAFARAMTDSTCAIRTMRLYEQLGLEHKDLRQPYAKQSGQAVRLAHGIPRSWGAWIDVPRVAKKGAPPPPWPLPGWVLLLGGYDGEQAHLVNVTDEEEDDVIVSVDGGQPDVDGPDDDRIPDGSIQRLRRRVVRTSTGVLRTYHATKGTPGRHVRGMFDLAGYVAKKRKAA